MLPLALDSQAFQDYQRKEAYVSGLWISEFDPVKVPNSESRWQIQRSVVLYIVNISFSLVILLEIEISCEMFFFPSRDF